MAIESTAGKQRAGLASTSSAQVDFPELRIVRRKDLLLHEETDAVRQVRLVDRLSRDGFLRNPPIVARLGGSERYLLLDGANRVSALDCLEMPCLFVQVERYEDPGVVLSHWNHVLRYQEAKSILEMVKSVPGILVAEASTLERSREHEAHHLCSVAFAEERVYQLFGGHDMNKKVRQLRRICSLFYHGDARIDRVSHADMEILRRRHPSFGCLIVYREFSKDEILSAAEGGLRLPSGLTRFLLPRRVLDFNMPLSVLKSEIPLRQKQRLLEEIIREKVRDRKVRYYEEPAFVFDD